MMRGFVTTPPPELWGNCWHCGGEDLRSGRCVRCGLTIDQDPLLGRQLGEVTALEMLMATPVARLYRAEGPNGEMMALRVIPDSLKDKAWAIKGFERLAAAVERSALPQNPVVLSQHKHGISEDGLAWIALDWFEGETLASLWFSGSAPHLSVKRAVQMAVQMGTALAGLHSAGIVHGCISPHAYHLRPGADGWVRLIHGGLGMIRKGVASNAPLTRGLTPQIDWRGATPWIYYRPPATEERAEFSERSDLYSLGVSIYQLFTRKLPYQPDKLAEVRLLLRSERHVKLVAARDRRAELDRYPTLMNTINRALNQKVEVRYANVSDFMEEFQAAYVRDTSSIESRYEFSQTRMKSPLKPRQGGPAKAPVVTPEAQREGGAAQASGEDERAAVAYSRGQRSRAAGRAAQGASSVRGLLSYTPARQRAERPHESHARSSSSGTSATQDSVDEVGERAGDAPEERDASPPSDALDETASAQHPADDLTESSDDVVAFLDVDDSETKTEWPNVHEARMEGVAEASVKSSSRQYSSRRLTPTGVSVDELMQVNRSLEASTRELLAILNKFEPEQSLRQLEVAISNRAPLLGDGSLGLDGSDVGLNTMPTVTSRSGQGARSTSSNSRLSAWSVICLSSTRLRRRARGTLQGMQQVDYRQALRPVHQMASLVSEEPMDVRTGAMVCLLGPSQNMESLLGRFIMFLMEFARRYRDAPPAVTLTAGWFNLTQCSRHEMPEMLRPLKAEAMALAPYTRSGELIARAPLFKALEIDGKSLPGDRGAPIDALRVWHFASKDHLAR